MMGGQGGQGGVLSPQDARRLMSVLKEMTEYVDGEDLDAISAQKPIYESGDVDELPTPDTETEGSGMRNEGGGEVMPHGMLHDDMGGKSPMVVLEEEKKVLGRPGRIDRRR
jgi:hypothetical protein